MTQLEREDVERLVRVEGGVSALQSWTEKADIKLDLLMAAESARRGGRTLISRVAPWVAVLVSIAAMLRAS